MMELGLEYLSKASWKRSIQEGVHQKLPSQNQRKEIQKENVCHQFQMRMIRKQKMLSQKKEEKKVSSAKTWIVSHNTWLMILVSKNKPTNVFEPLYHFLQNLLNTDHVTRRIKSILIEKLLSMIFTKNSLATEECDRQYKLSLKKEMLLAERMIQICQLNKIKIVS